MAFWHFLVGGRQTINQSINHTYSVIVTACEGGNTSREGVGTSCEDIGGGGGESIPEMENSWCKAMSRVFQHSEDGGWKVWRRV